MAAIQFNLDDYDADLNPLGVALTNAVVEEATGTRPRRVLRTPIGDRWQLDAGFVNGWAFGDREDDGAGRTNQRAIITPGAQQGWHVFDSGWYPWIKHRQATIHEGLALRQSSVLWEQRAQQYPVANQGGDAGPNPFTFWDWDQEVTFVFWFEPNWIFQGWMGVHGSSFSFLYTGTTGVNLDYHDGSFRFDVRDNGGGSILYTTVAAEGYPTMFNTQRDPSMFSRPPTHCLIVTYHPTEGVAFYLDGQPLTLAYAYANKVNPLVHETAGILLSAYATGPVMDLEAVGTFDYAMSAEQALAEYEAVTTTPGRACWRYTATDPITINGACIPGARHRTEGIAASGNNAAFSYQIDEQAEVPFDPGEPLDVSLAPGETIYLYADLTFSAWQPNPPWIGTDLGGGPALVYGAGSDVYASIDGTPVTVGIITPQTIPVVVV